MITLVYRHLKLFLKNPANIVLSFLSSLVILSLYFLFVRDFTIKAVGDYGFVSDYNNLFVDRLMTLGLLIVIGATSVLSIIFIFVKDHYSGVVIGFFTGVYIPIGYYPAIIRNIFFYFPLCQTTSLLRNVQTDSITSIILKNYPKSQHSLLYETFGVHLSFHDYTFSINEQLWMIFIVIILLNLVLLFLLQIKRRHLA